MENMNEILLNYIVEDGLILIPVLYVIGYIIKHTNILSNRWIPLVLLVIGIIFSIFLLNDPIVDRVIQGVLIAGVTVFIDQVKKQNFEKEGLNNEF